MIRDPAAAATPSPELTVRWTVGDIHRYGFETLRLSAWGAHNLFARNARYVVCVNSLPVEEARERAGELPDEVEWRQVDREVPPWLRRALDPEMADGAGWKLAPPRVEPSLPELSLDNDVILWNIPLALERWLEDERPDACCLAADLQRCYGRFEHLCGPEACNAGIRGIPPAVDLENELREVLAREGARLESEIDEQGLQVAVLGGHPCHRVGLDDVAVCSPWPEHLPQPGRAGAHFVGINAHAFPDEWGGRRAREEHEEHWRSLRPQIYERLGLRPDPRHH